jgi:hypothetical protein
LGLARVVLFECFLRQRRAPKNRADGKQQWLDASAILGCTDVTAPAYIHKRNAGHRTPISDRLCRNAYWTNAERGRGDYGVFNSLSMSTSGQPSVRSMELTVSA